MQIKSITRIATSLLAVSLLYAIYLVVAVPWIEPPVVVSLSTESQPALEETLARPTDRYRGVLSPLFPTDSWELNDAKVLKTEYGMLLVRDYRPLDNGRLQLHPCTIVMTPPGQSEIPGGSRPLVLEAPEGAILQFDRSLDLRAGKLGRLISGQLKGPITLRRRESAPQANDAMRLVTRSVQISQHRIWTPHEVEFQFGQTEGKGRDLMIEFSRTDETLTLSPTKQPPLQLRSLELVHVDYLRLVLPATARDSANDSSPSESTGANPTVGFSTDPVELTCQGPFFLDFLSRRATLEDTVDIRRLRPNGESDQLSCEQVSIYFDSADKATTGNSRMPKFRVDSLEAYGAPVNLSVPSMEIAVRARRLYYNTKTGTVEAEGPQGVDLRHRSHRLQALKVRYTLAAKGALGPIEATGPGKFSGSFQADSQQPLVASWQQDLTLVPQDSGYLLSLRGSSQLQLSGRGQLRAERIDVWLRSVHSAAPSQNPAMPNLQLDRMAAGGNVLFNAGRLQGGTDQLEVWYRDRLASDLRLPTQPDTPPSPSLDLSAANQEFASTDGKRIDVRGDHMRVLVSGVGANMQLDEVTVQGHVHLEELAAAEDPLPHHSRQTPPRQKQPTSLQGERLKLTDVTPTTGQAVMVGRPAKVHLRGISVEGMSVQLDRASNRVWIPGRGKARLPLTMGLDGQILAQPTQVDVDWQGQMNFDGLVLSFHDDVKLRGPDQLMQMQALSVHLTQPLRMDQTEGAMTVPQIEQVVGEGEVYFEQSTHEGSQLTAVDRMALAALRIQPSTGDVSGDGPGWVTSVRKGMSPASLPLGGKGPATDRSPADGPAADQLSSLRIDFQQGIEGNLKRRELHFVDQVRATLGAVTDWNFAIDARQVGNSENAFGLLCDRLSVVQMHSTANRRPSVELVAMGNTTVEGNGFTARAYRLSYAQEKDLLVLEGDGRTDALLWRQTRIGGPRDQAAAGKIYFWPSTNRIKVDDIRMLEFGSLSKRP